MSEAVFGLIKGLLIFLCTFVSILFIASANVSPGNKEVIIAHSNMVWFLMCILIGYLFGRGSRVSY